jgi:hypothetical protein
MTPQRTSLRVRLACDDAGFLDFMAALLTLDPNERPSAATALQHPWLRADAELPCDAYVLP